MSALDYVDDDPGKSGQDIPFQDDTASDQQLFHQLIKHFQDMVNKNPEMVKSLNEKFLQILKETERERWLGGNFPSLSNLEEEQVDPDFKPGSHGAGRFKTFRKRDAELKMNVAKRQKFSRVSQVAKTRKKGNSVKARNHKKGKGKVRKSGKNKINDKNNKISKWRSSKKKRKIRKTLTVQKMKQKKKQFQGKSPKERLLARNNDPNNCTALWAKLTNFGLRAASSIKKQAKSTQNNDRITESKRSKGEEYNKHKDILVQALGKQKCTGTTKRGANATGKKIKYILIDPTYRSAGHPV